MKLAYQRLDNGETVAHVTLHGSNRDPRVLEWHRRVMVDHWGIPVNYVECPFHLGVSHGHCMNELLRATVDLLDAPIYVWLWDVDCILLRRDGLRHVIDTVKNRRTLWGTAWSSSHKAKPGGGKSHPYAGSPCVCFATDLYKTLGRPDCDHHNPRSDTIEELSYACEERGFTLALAYPSSSDEPYTVQLSQTCRYGRSIMYGVPPTFYHETRADLPGATERFIATCERLLRGEYE